MTRLFMTRVGLVILVGLFCTPVYAGSFNLVGIHPDAAAQSTSTGKRLAALAAFNGKIYAGYGDYNANTGPINLRSFNHESGAFSNSLLSSPTEAIYQFREFDGKLYAPDIDPVGAGLGGYATATVSGDNESWVHTVPVLATHVYDIASFEGELWMCGSLNNDAVVWRYIPGSGWVTSLSVPPDQWSWVRCYGLGVYDGKLYTTVDEESRVKSRVFDGTSWSDGPSLTPSGYHMSNAMEFDGKLVYQRYEVGLGYATTMNAFDGTTVSEISSDPILDYKIVGDRMYTLLGDSNRSIKYTTDMVNWETIGDAPAESFSLAIMDEELYVGDANGELYRFQPDCGEFGYVSRLDGDLNNDCYVNFLDFAELGNGWQSDCDFSDLAVMAANWLNCIDPNSPCDYCPLSISGLSPVDYEVSYDDLGFGGLLYYDRTYTYTAVPAAYQNKTYIRTSNDDKSSSSLTVTFDVDKDAAVYVAHDDRITNKPSWLGSFTDTGDGLVENGEDVHMSLYKKLFPAGTVNLYENVVYSQPNCSMYTIVVIEQ